VEKVEDTVQDLVDNLVSANTLSVADEKIFTTSG